MDPRNRRERPSILPSPEGYAGKMPLYALGVNNRGFAVASGGGGTSKTGIPNGLIFFKYNQEKIEKIGEHHTSADAITSLDIHPEENEALFVDTDKLAKVQFSAGGTVLRNDTISNPLAKKVKVIRFSPDASKVVLGCYEGPLHVVSYQKGKKKEEVVTLSRYPALATTGSAPTAHTEDIDDVAWHPQASLLATVSKDVSLLSSSSKDKTAKVWKGIPGTLQAAHTLTCSAEGSVLTPRGCRFSPSSPSHLYVSAFIMSKATYIFVWNTENGALIKKAKILSFAMNASGTYVAVGDVDGTIVVAEADKLRKVLQVKPHGFIVPALAFTPPIKAITGSATKKREKGSKLTKKEATSKTDRGAVISVGADYACKFTPIIHQSFVNTPLVAIIVGILVALLAIFLKYILNK